MTDLNSAHQTRLNIQDLTKSFGDNHVLKGINLDIQPGESLAIIGGSGSGKSVFLKCILGLLKPDAPSQVLINDTDVTKLSESELRGVFSHTSMLFQGSALFDSLSIWENICFGLLQTKSINRARAQDLAAELLPQVGLKEDVARRFPAELSGGMQRRVALARAIATKPKLLFFDEPTAGLDPIMSGIIDQLIVDNIKHLNATAITITHNMQGAKTVADRIAMLHQGKLIWIGNTCELADSGNAYVDQFIHGRIEGPIQVEV